MRKYRIVIHLKIDKEWADYEDFEEYIREFNEANKGVMEAAIVEVKEEEENHGK